ncbi:hypothetical protein [Kineococcus sp. SYSU DK005]|uniref:hypothetical protein n=1 Tax=Kineococcus sp. SYSU DK005 TaxID=3383126 RepID=UPI003D7D1AE7
MYQPCSAYRRTPAQRADQELSWHRSDQAFFASGACHVLAFAFQHTHPDAGFCTIALRKTGEKHASHVYVSNGTWAFDHDGWTLEVELLEVTAAAEPDAAWERLIITSDLDTFCVQHHHLPPHLYARSPWQRAYGYLARFGPAPAASAVSDPPAQPAAPAS